MKLTNKLFSHGFGHLGYHIKNQVTYVCSAFEQNATHGVISKGIPNAVRRIKSQILLIAIPAFVYYNLFLYTEEVQRKMDRKTPTDYENDV